MSGSKVKKIGKKGKKKGGSKKGENQIFPVLLPRKGKRGRIGISVRPTEIRGPKDLPGKAEILYQQENPDLVWVVTAPSRKGKKKRKGREKRPQKCLPSQARTQLRK